MKSSKNMSWVTRYLGNKVATANIRSTIRNICVAKIGAKPVLQANRIAPLKLPTPETHSFRSKYTSKKKRQEEESDSDDNADDDENEVSLGESKDKSSKVVKVHVNSLRADLIIKAGLGIARNKVEELFYSNRLRVNGKRIFKKSIQLGDDDEVDVIRGVSPMNPDFLVVSRIKILSATATEDRITVKLERFKSLIVENYEDPWKDAESS